MHTETLADWQHDHAFGQEMKRPGEVRTWWVIGITAVVMVIEIVSGWRFGSMALLADGLHMGSHATALLISAFAYVYARRHAADPHFSFGTGKVNALAGFTGAMLLIGFAFLMAWESVGRLLQPITIAFGQATLVAVLGLIVNAVCAWILGSAGHGHHHGTADTDHPHHHHHHDHNLRSAYLHVVADALTSVLAIVALLSGRYLGWTWLDPVMGIVGAILVGRWSWGLLRDTSRVLLDHQAPDAVRRRIADSLEAIGDSRVADLHVWSIGPGLYAAEICVVTHEPQPLSRYQSAIDGDLGIVHTTIQVCTCKPAEDTTASNDSPT